MLLSSVRGCDATGFAAINSNTNKVILSKAAKDPIYFRQTMDKKMEDVLSNPVNNAFLGHNRWSTRGKTGGEGAQPFTESGIVGTHNGTIESYNMNGYHTDSHELISNIAFGGVKPTIDKLTDKDSYAIVYYDTYKREIVFTRNRFRPLHFAINPKRSVLYYASEPGLLYAALWRRDIDIDEPYSFNSDYIYTIDPARVKGKDGKLVYRATAKSNVVVPKTEPETKTSEVTNDTPPFDV